MINVVSVQLSRVLTRRTKVVASNHIHGPIIPPMCHQCCKYAIVPATCYQRRKFTIIVNPDASDGGCS